MSLVYIQKLFLNKKIRYAVVDQAQVAAKHTELFKKMRDITISLTTRIATLTPNGGDVKFYDTIDEAMEDSTDYDLVFIQSVGNFIKSNEILKELENYTKANPDFFIVAFTLDWQSEHGKGWVECHHQMLFVNVNTWKQVGSPKFGGWDTVEEELPNYSRSEENFHDKYTPYWMKGEPGTTLGTRSKQGTGFIKAAFEHSIKIDNFTDAMRKTRLYVYPESETSELHEAFTRRNTRLVSNPNQKKWIRTLSPAPTIWIYNSERYYFEDTEKICDTYFGPASGFKYLDILNGNDKVKFVFYDFHQKSIDWIKQLKETWDGNDFPAYINNQSVEFNEYYKYVNKDIKTNQDLLFHDFGGEENFKVLWNRFKECEAEYIVCDLFDLEQVKNLIAKTKGNVPFFYYSNIFATDYTVINFTLKEITDHHTAFLQLIFDAYPDGLTHGCNEFGEWVNSPLKSITV
jgi:hypothetical protein